jgi:two-component system, cell cycle response regulator
MVSAPDILNASILIVDDQKSNISLLERLLSEAGYTCVASTMNPQEVCALHRKNRYDLILLDLKMPGMDGFEVMEGLKTNDADGYLPVLVITARPGHKLRALQAGAKDFISKPFDLVEVKTRIHNMLEVRLLYKTMRNLSIRDPLTGLFNRRYMEEALALELHRTKRNDAQLAVIMIDIDHFKQFNDDFGHDGGDAILRALGAFFKEQVRGSDIACRYGGEEFILILSPSTAEGARQRAEKIREDARLLSVSHANRNLGAITLSLGVAIFPDHASEAEAIVKAADVALYQAKRGGRNRVVMCVEKAEQITLQR